MRLLEVHILQTVAPSNLNRDDTGSPKDALFGGFRRARISSQAQKRAVRVAFRDWPLLSEEERAVRTKRLVEELLRRLAGVEEELARRVIENALNALGFGVKEGRTEYLLFLGNRELDALAQGIRENLEALSGEVKGKKKAEVPPELKKALERVLDGGKAVDLALFGRMLADRPELGVDAAAQVAHALSTHKVDREFDFYTAVDDLNPKEDTGAGMMGDVEFYSATLYRYAVVDLDRLVENLQGDKELALKGVLAFLEAFALTLPRGSRTASPPTTRPSSWPSGRGRGCPATWPRPLRLPYGLRRKSPSPGFPLTPSLRSGRSLTGSTGPGAGVEGRLGPHRGGRGRLSQTGGPEGPQGEGGGGREGPSGGVACPPSS